jgi:ribonuclease P protein component
MGPRRTIGRLTRTEEFRRVYRDGVRRASALVVVHSSPNGLTLVRLGVSVGRRFGRAVQRNRLRRRLREAVRWHRPRMQRGVDLVVVPRAAAADAAYAELRDGVSAALGASGVLTGNDTP